MDILAPGIDEVRLRRRSALLAGMFESLLAVAISAFAGRIIVDNIVDSDEWTVSDQGFRNEGVANGSA